MAPSGRVGLLRAPQLRQHGLQRLSFLLSEYLSDWNNSVRPNVKLLSQVETDHLRLKTAQLSRILMLQLLTEYLHSQLRTQAPKYLKTNVTLKP